MTQEAPYGIYSLRHKLVKDPAGGGVIFNPYANMHDPSEAKIEWFTQNGFHIKGVVHVGAAEGKELAWYVTKNYTPILAFEPHPHNFSELKTHYWNHALLWPFALGAQDGTVRLNIPVDGDLEKSSKYKPIPTEGHDWTKVSMGESIEVPMYRFDTWASVGGIDMSPFNTLIIDVQGMELEVLQGFGRFLQGFEFLCIECSLNPIYDGEAAAQEVVAWLEDRDFVSRTKIEEHDDVMFIKKEYAPSN